MACEAYTRSFELAADCSSLGPLSQLCCCYNFLCPDFEIETFQYLMRCRRRAADDAARFPRAPPSRPLRRKLFDGSGDLGFSRGSS